MRWSKPSKRADRSVSAGSRRELLDELLVELPSLRRERDDAVVRRAAVDGVERGGDDVDAQHHPRPAAVRVVVDLARAQRSRVAVVEDAQLELGAEHRRQRTALANPGERVGDEREDVEAHDARTVAVSR